MFIIDGSMWGTGTGEGPQKRARHAAPSPPTAPPVPDFWGGMAEESLLDTSLEDDHLLHTHSVAIARSGTGVGLYEVDAAGGAAQAAAGRGSAPVLLFVQARGQ